MIAGTSMRRMKANKANIQIAHDAKTTIGSAVPPPDGPPTTRKTIPDATAAQIRNRPALAND